MWVYYTGEKIILFSDKKMIVEPLGVKSIYADIGNDVDFNDYVIRDDKIMLKAEIPFTAMRVAIISDYGVNCGIATYTKYLADEIKVLVKQVKIFAEDVPNKDDDDGIVYCWNRGGDYRRVVPEMKKFDPDLIIIQHEFGLFPNQGTFSCLMSQLSRWRTLVVLHTVLEHRVHDKEARADYTTRCITEMSCPEVVVHTPLARATLRDRGYSGKIHYIPHGCFPAVADNRLPSTKYGLYSPHSIIQYGFGGIHKGWETAIEVVRILKSKYEDIIYLGVFNISQFGSSAQIAYYRKLLDIVEEKGLSGCVAIHKGFQSDEMIKNLIRCSSVAFYPYQIPNQSWASWGASGAIRLPLSLSIPLVLSNYPCFQEFNEIFTLVNDAEEAAAEIDHIFSDTEYEQSLRQKAVKITEERSWSKIALAFLSCTSDAEFNTL